MAFVVPSFLKMSRHLNTYLFFVPTLVSSAIKADSVLRQQRPRGMYSKVSLATGLDAGEAVRQVNGFRGPVVPENEPSFEYISTHVYTGSDKNATTQRQQQTSTTVNMMHQCTHNNAPESRQSSRRLIEPTPPPLSQLHKLIRTLRLL